MRSMTQLTLGVLALAAIGCDSGTSSDPKTVTRGELNPPTGLISVTSNDGLELRWDAANAEDELQGYDVFVVESTLDAVKANAPGYPKNLEAAATLDTGSFPRCALNTKLFQAFGFKASEKDCEGDAETSTTAKTATGARLLEEGTGTTTVADKLTNFVPCDKSDTGTAVADMSLKPSEIPTLKQQNCKVSQFWNVTTGKLEKMTTGKTYVAFVATIAGDDKSTMSWTSNFVEDALHARRFDGKLTFAAGKSLFLPLAQLIGTETLDKSKWAQANCVTAVCKVNQKNDQAGGLWLGRFGTDDPSFPQRVFFSAPAGNDIQVQLRGPQTIDPRNPTVVSSTIPGDEATSTYVNDGTLFPVYGNQVFDLKVTSGGETHYGKVVFGSIEPLPESAATEFDVPVVVIMQPLAGSMHYLN